MALDRPTIQQIRNRQRADLIQSVNIGETDTSKHIDPNIRNSLIGGVVDSMSAGFDENYDAIEQAQASLFPTTATGDELDRWGAQFGINQQEAKKASGNITFSGTAFANIPISTLLQKSDGLEYITTSAATIISQSLTIISLTRIGSTVTATTASDHNLASNIVIDSITGANESEYNVTNTPIIVTATNQFTYNINTTPTTPATGSILVNFTTASVNIEALENGDNYNAISGSQFSLVSPIAGVDSNAYAQYTTISGGLDIESDDNYRKRILERTSNFAAPFSEAGLPSFIKENNAGVTRVWVDRAIPAPGSTTIYFTRDSDINQIPNTTQADAVKATITNVDTGILPANMSTSSLFVSGPTAITIDFIFATLAPNTTDMQTAITNNLRDYFRNDTVVALDVTLDNLKRIIGNTIDSNGNVPTFTLTTPAADVVISAGELGILGTIIYPV
jgi:uncharacterized phage protein gp47/JayE